MDLSKFSTQDLQAMQAGDLSKVSTQGLIELHAQTHQAAATQQLLSDQAAANPTNDMSTGERVLAGIGQGMASVGRGLSQFISSGPVLLQTPTDVVNPLRTTQADVEAAKATDAPLLATTAGKVGSAVGKGAAIAPAMLIPGANTYAGAAAIGGGAGGLTTEGGLLDRAKGAAAGAAGGAVGLGVGKLVGAGYRALKAAAEPFYDAGQQQIIGRALQTAAGSDAPAVAQRLSEAAQPFVGPAQGVAPTTLGELVPGSLPTAGQAAQNPGVAALERAAMATQPDVTTQLASQLANQNAARVAAVSDVAGTGGLRDMTAAARDATAGQLYGQARATGIDSAALSPEALANIAAFQKRIPGPILASAKELAQINGTPMTDATSLEGMHWVKQALDGAIGTAQRAGDNTKTAALVGLKNDLLQGMDALSPEYAAARSVYADMSKPLNQMDVAQVLLDKSVSPLTGTLSPAKYANAFNDATAKTATGFPGATLEGTVDNASLNRLASVLADVQRANAAQNVGRGVGSDTVQKLAYANMLQQAGVPSLVRQFAPAQVVGNLGARAADVAYGQANKTLSNRLAQTLLSPADAAAAMQAAQSSANPLVVRLANNRLIPLLGINAGLAYSP